MEFLHEIGRIKTPIADVWEVLSEDYGISEATGEVQLLGRQARLLGWTRDPFDRLIVAHALADDAILLSADETIRKHCPRAQWS